MKDLKQRNAEYCGVGIGKRCVSGRLRFLLRSRPSVADPDSGEPHDMKQEQERLQRSLAAVKQHLEKLAEQTRRTIGEKEAEIFEIHAMLLSDVDFVERMEHGLRDGMGAEAAVEAAGHAYAEQLRAVGDAYLSARAVDLMDVTDQLLDQLMHGGEVLPERAGAEPYILVADELTPSQTVTLERALLLGIVTFSGTPNSHTAILARAMGIPALVGVGEIPQCYDGCIGLLDAADGALTLCPTEERQAAFQSKKQALEDMEREREERLRRLIDQPAVTLGGHRIFIYSNVGEEAEVDAAIRNGADGVGLLRSEFLYLALDRYPTEQELFDRYRNMVSKLKEKRMIIRTLDIGADKQIPYFELPKEENPALGFRGVRISLARPEVFKTQLRAILRASAYGKTAVMIPMVVSVEEVRACRRLLQSCMEELEQANVAFDRTLEFGVMIETPAAALMSEEIAAEVEFFSVGTNDLTQYTLAADRQNPLVEQICRENQEPILRLIAGAADAIHRHGGWIGVCGELAADVRWTQRLLELGIDELSVTPTRLLEVRNQVMQCR